MYRMFGGTEPQSSNGYLQEPLSLREEFRSSRFGLGHSNPSDFLRSQWQSKPKSSIFLAYRWLLGGFFNVGLVNYVIQYYRNGTVFIYLTNWAFIMCGITSITGAVLVTIYHCKPETWVPPRCVIKTYWAFYWTTIIMECLIAITYWAAIYPDDRVLTNPTRVSDFYNIFIHLLPPIFFTIDHIIVAQPARLLHFVYPMVFGYSYGLFALIYYELGGLNYNGNSFIYTFLDFENPKMVLVTVSMITLATVFLSVLQYGVYRLRTFIARKMGKLL
ncbi:protein rolling stone isoform X1 [Drosophila suzukii]|uniref:Protein rolling stone isoform X1 n=1 Tax=Drosophila suzukii TaxID=28584 RepID=A0AB40AFJ1_DROSZ